MKLGRGATADEILKARVDNWPEAVTPIARLMVRVFRFSRLVLDNAGRAVAAHGLTGTEFDVLTTLRGTPPPHELAPTGLYDAVLISSGGLTKVLYSLERRNLVTRAEGEADRRSKPVRLTAKGRALVERAMADVLRSDAKLIASALSEREVERLIQLLHKLLERTEGVAAKTQSRARLRRPRARASASSSRSRARPQPARPRRSRTGGAD